MEHLVKSMITHCLTHKKHHKKHSTIINCITQSQWCHSMHLVCALSIPRCFQAVCHMFWSTGTACLWTSVGLKQRYQYKT